MHSAGRFAATLIEDDHPDVGSTTCEAIGPEALNIVDFEAPEDGPNSRAARRRFLRRRRQRWTDSQ